MNFKQIIYAVCGLVIFSGCSSMVKKPEIERVKKIAVLSVFANATIPDKKGRGIVGGEGWSDSMRLEVASNALQVFEEHLTKTGWEVVPGNTVITSKEYLDAFRPPVIENKTANKVMGFLSKLAEQQQRNETFSPPGMFPIYLEAKEGSHHTYGDAKKSDPKNLLADWAKKLQVDAVALAYIDYCYQSGTWSIGGTGEAVITAGTTVKLVNQAGQIVLNMPDVPRCEGDTRAESKNSMGQNGGKLMLGFTKDKKIQTMFSQATRGSFEKSFKIIAKEIK